MELPVGHRPWYAALVGLIWYFDAVHPIHEWTYTCKVIGRTVAGVALHSPDDPEHYGYVAQYIYAIQHGLRHLLNITILPINLTGDIPTLTQLLVRLHEGQPRRFYQYRSCAIIWAQNLCVAHAEQEMLRRHAPEGSEGP